MNTGNERIKITKKKEIGIITFNRPEVMNVIDTETLQELEDSLARLETDTQIRVIIITGDKTFSSGADVKELKEKHPDEAEAFSMLGHNVCDHVENMVKPVIAAVNGYALGAGCEVALACDIRIAGKSAKFGQPEVNLGLIPGFGATQRLTRLVGIGWAKEHLGTKKSEIVQDIANGGHIGLFMGKKPLLDNLPNIARWIKEYYST